MKFQKARKEQSKLRLAIFGPSGSGKTFSSLRIASGMTDKIAVIDTERGSASKYASQFQFDVLELPASDIDTYVKAINLAGSSGYEVLIIDSLTHAWQELLQEVDRIAQAQFKGNTWAAWSKGTPRQQSLVNAILGFDGHIIATMRTRTEWTIGNDNGKNRPVRVGLAPQQGKGIEYEFDLLMEMTTDHLASVIKDRTGKFQDEIIDKPGEKFGKQLMDWLADGLPPRHWSEDDANRQQLIKALEKRGYGESDLFFSWGVDGWDGMKVAESGKVALEKLTATNGNGNGAGNGAGEWVAGGWVENEEEAVAA